MSKLTRVQMLIAADMCDDMHVSLAKDSSPDYVEAAAFVFDNGLFFLGAEHCHELAILLRNRAALEQSNEA